MSDDHVGLEPVFIATSQDQTAIAALRQLAESDSPNAPRAAEILADWEEHGEPAPTESADWEWVTEPPEGFGLEEAVTNLDEEFTVSTFAFDATLISDAHLLVWTTRGFVSGDRCGFDVMACLVNASPEEVSDFPGHDSWWGFEAGDYPLSLAADGQRIPLEVVTAGGANGETSTRLFTSVSFPTPEDCNSLTLRLDATQFWSVCEVTFDTDELRTSLTRWNSSHPRS